jgi:hypothetical protein
LLAPLPPPPPDAGRQYKKSGQTTSMR